MSDEKKRSIIIEGVTEGGQQFRPSDWAERMSETMATFRNRRLAYSPLLQPTVNEQGFKCVRLDAALKKSNPELYASILAFAENNNLKICSEK